MSKALISITKLLEEHKLDINKGDMFIDDRGTVYRVECITKRGIDLESKDGSEDWSHYSIIEFDGWKRNNYIKIDRPIEELEEDVLNEVKDLSKYEEDNTLSDSTEIVPTAGKQHLVGMANSLEAKKQNLQILERVLERKKHQLWCMVAEYKDKLAKIYKVIGVLELYLGINEDIIQIREGDPAPPNTPISFRQMILYMDEEVGDPSDQGLDFQTIDEFDSWLLKDNNIDRLLPEIKGVVIIRPRRFEKEYGDWYTNFVYNKENKKTYVLIRNGQRIYRIWADIVIQPRLFPGKTEIDDMFKHDDDGFSSSRSEIEDRVFSYKQNALMLQGLIDRTEVFRPITHNVNLFEGAVLDKKKTNFIYDDVDMLTDGRLRWKDWKKKINSTIKRGSRIYFAGLDRYERGEKGDNSYHLGYQYRYAILPGSGFYKVTWEGEEKSTYSNGSHAYCKFVYNPKDEVWNDDLYSGSYYHERKQGISFKFSRDANFIFNYDLVSLEDVEYYINNRVDRKNYYSMIPLLWSFKRMRLEEVKWEKQFVKLVANRTKVEEKLVWEAVKWWKYKNIWKRPIKEDDAKALRMIERKVKQLLGEKKGAQLRKSWHSE